MEVEQAARVQKSKKIFKGLSELLRQAFFHFKQQIKHHE